MRLIRWVYFQGPSWKPFEVWIIHWNVPQLKLTLRFRWVNISQKKKSMLIANHAHSQNYLIVLGKGSLSILVKASWPYWSGTSEAFQSSSPESKLCSVHIKEVQLAKLPKYFCFAINSQIWTQWGGLKSHQKWTYPGKNGTTITPSD